MRVGVTCAIEYSVFSSGLTNMSLAIGELFKSLGHTVKMLNLRGNRPWWDDCTPIQKMYDVLNLDDLSNNTERFDVIFEVSQLVLTAEMRAKLTNKSVWIIRKPFVLTEIESTIYPVNAHARDFTGMSEAWLLDDVTAKDDMTAVETLTGLTVRHVPFVWTPILAEAQSRAVGGTQWKGNSAAPFFIRMADTNQSSSSSSTIPLVIIRELARRHLPVEGWALHNGEHIANSKFFKENVLKHCADLDVSGACVGRQRSVEWVRDENVVVLVNLRFNRLRPILLDLAWAGIPVIHNSPALRELGHGAERLYYSDNSIEEGVQAFQNIMSDLKSSVGWFTSARARREELIRKWSPVSPLVRMGWLQALNNVVGMEMLRPTPAVTAAPVEVPVEAPITSVKETPYTVVFSDMWEAFQPDYNFFTLLLNEAGKHMTPPRTVVGVAEADYKGTPDLVIFGPFNNIWKRFTNSPKICFTGENTRPVSEADLNIGFDHVNFTPTSKYIRFPLWMMSINWFAADVERLVNPKPIPLECCTRTYETTLESRKKFCAFIVSNPCNRIRNMAFQALNEYKDVDSAGQLYNTVGDELVALGGGGGGELKKMKFLSDYKFAITYENGSNEGYCTEKLLHAKAAGAVPIYWGDPWAQRDFNMDGVIDARNFKTPAELISAVEAVDKDDALWKKKAATPALNQYMVDRTRRTLAELAKQAWALLKVDEEALKQIPRFLGAETGSVEARQGVEYFDRVIAPTVVAPLKPETPLLVTYVTFNFLGSLQHWLGTLQAQRTVMPDLEALVFIGPDVPDETLAVITEKFQFATFERVDSSWTPPNFTDFWEPGNYAWKIWIYNTVVNREELKGRMCMYLDAGAVLCRWPLAWMLRAQEHGICCLEDPRENNDRWCGPTFCEILKVTDEEREHKQITAGLITFRAGHPLPVKFFAEAFELCQNRDVLVGPRISGVDANGRSYGHRQDQSILSLLVRRHDVPLYPLDNVYGDRSMRKTFEAGQCIYVHRGNFQRHVPFLQGIDDAYVINLDRRADRLEKFRTTHPDISGAVERWPATDGKTLQLTPELAKLFRPNDFFWKKAVMGCALSHLGLWWKLLNEKPDIENFLIFEDDARLLPGWQETLQLSMNHLPEDYDVLYLGGILPPNRAGFDRLLEPVTKYYSRIRPHQMFGQSAPTPYFHSCAYAYIISRKGARKVIESIQEKEGYWTSADHMLCSPCESMNLFFLTPTIAGCYQDDDPNYANSDFNNFSRVDKFDSDLWNNDERFSKEEIGINAAKLDGVDFNNIDLLQEVYKKKRTEGASLSAHSSTAFAVQSEGASLSAHSSSPPPAEKGENSLIPAITISKDLKALPSRFVCLKEQSFDFSKLYESKWLFSLFGDLKAVTVDHVELSSAVPTDCPIFILQRPHILAATKLLIEWSKAGAIFKILHLSDELPGPQKDPLIIYQLPNCISVLRTYIRDDFPPGTEKKIRVIPLGYRWSQLNSSQSSLLRTPNTPFRENHWCFFGTDWNGRSELLAPLLKANLLKSCKFFPNWNDPSGLTCDEYLYEMTNSIFVPCPDGVNPETFRFYEALEAGCIPLIVKTEKNAEWFKWVSDYIPLIANDSWEDALRIMFTLLSNPKRLELYREQILRGWWSWVEDLKEQGREWLLLRP